MITTISKIFTLRNIAVDILILTGIYFIPAVSHLTPIPLYYLDPMRFFMLAGFVLTRNNSNTFLLALTIPIFSALVTGHPTIFKALLISIELTVNILFFIKLLKYRKLHIALSMLVSIMASKIIYYTLKFASIKFNFIEGDLITTSLWVQLGTLGFITIFFYLIWRNFKVDKQG